MACYLLKALIEKQSQDLKNAIDKRVEQGFVELEAMSEEPRASIGSRGRGAAERRAQP